MPSCSLRSPSAAISILPSRSTSASPKLCLQLQLQQPAGTTNELALEFTTLPVGMQISGSDEMLKSVIVTRSAAVGRQKRRSRRDKKDRMESEWAEEKQLVAESDLEEEYCRSSTSKMEKSRYLTRKQEAVFSQCLKEEFLLEKTSKQMMQLAPLELQVDAEFRFERKNRDKAFLRARESKERILLSYKRLVISVASTYQGKGLSLEDLVQEGCIGLLRGAERFDHSKGYKLSTYVYWWIKQAIVRALVNKSRTIRLPGNLCEAINKVLEAKRLLRNKLGRLPTYEEIADFADTSVSTVGLVLEKSRQPISIDQPVDGDEMTLKDIIAGPNEMRPEVQVTKQTIRHDLEKRLKMLNRREELVIRLRYGLNGQLALSFEEIGRLINLSRERIRQIHSTALTRIQEDKCFVEGLRQIIVQALHTI